MSKSIVNSRLDASSKAVKLTELAHIRAQQYLQEQKSNPRKAKQVYLNTLAIYAVDFLLQCWGYNTDWNSSDSADIIMRTLMDVADLIVENHGSLECRPVLPGSDTMYVPEEVWSERIGYIAVQLDRSLQEATLLGFTEQVAREEIPLSELRSLADLPTYLNRLRKEPIALSKWLQGIFESGWRTLTAFPEYLEPAYRSQRQIELSDEASVKGAKLIDLGTQLGSQSVALFVVAKPAENESAIVRLQVHPAPGQQYLPSNLKLALLSEEGEVIEQSVSRAMDFWVQLPLFQCSKGEKFRVEVSLDEFSFTEDFIV